jgi:glycosyltransferase involved in cell wall biosynthesis
MKNENQLISIVVPVFNRVGLIAETLNSVVDQTYLNWECIIIDDGSSDGTQDSIAEFLKNEARFRFIQRDREPKGAPTCRNIGVERALGDYIIFLDSDDLLVNTCLENRMEIAHTFPENDFWVFRTALFSNRPGDSPKKWNVLNKEMDDLQRFILIDIPWQTTGTFWRKRVIQGLGGFDENSICWQDWELHIRAIIGNLKYWKSSDNQSDSYYRMNKCNNWDSISTHHNELSHILFRVELFNKFFLKVTSKDHRKEVKEAFSVLFYRLFMELYNHGEKKHLVNLHNSLLKLKIFSPLQLIVLRLLTINLNSKRGQVFLLRVIHKFLCLLNQDRFQNKTGMTFHCE